METKTHKNGANGNGNHGKQDESARLRGDLLTFARRISHDLRTPLGGIIAAGEALKETLADHGLPAALADSVLQSAEELSKLIRRVSVVAKASASPVVKEPLSMGHAVLIAVQQLETRALKQNAVITQPEEWPEVQAVAGWLEVIWWNLLSNALQHAGPTPKIELGWRPDGKNFRFWISDNGPALSEDARTRLFQTFHSLHEPNSSRGLGLPIVQRLVELQDGTCGYEAKPDGTGSFFFTLPAAN